MVLAHSNPKSQSQVSKWAKKDSGCREQRAQKLNSCLDLGTQDMPEIQHLCDFEVAIANLVYVLHWLIQFTRVLSAVVP